MRRSEGQGEGKERKGEGGGEGRGGGRLGLLPFEMSFAIKIAVLEPSSYVANAACFPASEVPCENAASKMAASTPCKQELWSR